MVATRTPSQPMTAITSDAHMQPVKVLDIPVNCSSMDDALAAIASFVASDAKHHVITADSSMAVMGRTDQELRRIVEDASLVTPDSVGILWAAHRKDPAMVTRVSGVELVEELCKHSVTEGYSLYFLGAAPGIAQLATERMADRYKGTHIAGAQHGYFQEPEVAAVIDEINAARSDILCVAMGIPRQEKWIASHKHLINASVFIGVGGTFDVLSGTVKRAPRLFQRLKLEWLWRVMANPKKIGKVMLLPRFVWMVITSNSRGAR